MIKKIFSSELGKGAFILLVMMNIFNLINFLFQFIMGRALGPEGYGTLAALMSLTYIYTIPTEAIQNIIAKYTSKFNLKKQNKKIKFIMFKSLKKGFRVGFWIFLVAAIFSIFLSKFLGINYWLILITNLFIFWSFLNPITSGVLQGRKKFKLLGTSLIIMAILKLFFALSLVILGFKVFGAIIGVLLGIFSGLIFSFYFNKEILHEKEEKTSLKEIYPKSVPYFISMIVIFLMLSIDIILAKRFFSPELAGKYSVLSMLGKIIFFGTMGMSKAMFPLASEKHEANKEHFDIFKKSFVIILFLCIVAVTIYALFPKLVIGILYGSQYLDISSNLIYAGLALSFLSLGHLILVYGLSTNKLEKSPYLFVFLVIQIILLSLFHNNIKEYLVALIISNAIMFGGSFFFIKSKGLYKS
jgi:O-antigen/teichoic acid export membrane protein